MKEQQKTTKNPEMKTKTPKKKAANTCDIFDFLEELPPQTNVFELIKIGSTEVAVNPFVSTCIPVTLHYCEENELGGWVICNGKNCTLCDIGKKPEQRLLLPVFLPTEDKIGVLSIPKTKTPRSLLPQLAPALKQPGKNTVFLSREGSKYNVTTKPLAPGANGGAKLMKAFIDEFDQGDIDLTSIFTKLTNDELLEVDAIHKMAELKGLLPDEVA